MVPADQLERVRRTDRADTNWHQDFSVGVLPYEKSPSARVSSEPLAWMPSSTPAVSLVAEKSPAAVKWTSAAAAAAG